MLNDRPNRPQMETGARLAMRALGWGSLYAITGVGAVSGLIWWLSGASDVRSTALEIPFLNPFPSTFSLAQRLSPANGRAAARRPEEQPSTRSHRI